MAQRDPPRQRVFFKWYVEMSAGKWVKMAMGNLWDLLSYPVRDPYSTSRLDALPARLASTSCALSKGRALGMQVVLLLVLVPVAVSAQEVCDNGVDDDGNALVDLNDPACQCNTMISSGAASFIPNPSFEEQLCCPYWYNFSNEPPWLNCAQQWQQATQPTTDLFDACGLYPNVFPIPPPDGDAFVGMRVVEGWQEYVGACLSYPGQTTLITAGGTYTLSFHVAATSIRVLGNQTFSDGAFYADPVPLAVFGLEYCVPFPVATVDCPGSVGWVELGSMDYYGDGGWSQVSFTFTPDTDIRTVMIGTGCALPPSFSGGAEDSLQFTPYLLLDDLVLTEATDQVLTPVTSTGHYCSGNVVVSASPPATATDHQWYLDGVALVGLTDPTLNVSALGLGHGTYTFASTYNGQCLMGSTNVQGPITPTPAFAIGPLVGCAPLTVEFLDTTGAPVVATAWDLGDGTTAAVPEVVHTYTVPGSYDIHLTIRTDMGCEQDSLMPALIEVVDEPIAVALVIPNPSPASSPVVLEGGGSSGGVILWHWDVGSIIPGTLEGEQVNGTAPDIPGTYPVRLAVSGALGCVDTVWTQLIVVGDITMPNVFTPNGDGDNDLFLPLEVSGVEGTLEIHNRWGQVIYSTNRIDAGWDGRVQGQLASEGTYYYLVTPAGEGEALHGHFMLLR